MTIAQHMLASFCAAPRVCAGQAIVRFALLLLGCSLLASCSSSSKYAKPTAHLPSKSGVIWAVAPLQNQSGASVVDELAMTDVLVGELSQAPGLVVLPTNRTIAAMRSLGLSSVDSPAAARSIAQALGADALVVGAITAWNPYDPPIMGLSLAIFAAAQRDSMNSFGSSDDPMALRGLASEGRANSAATSDRPAAVFSAVFDASSGNTRELIRSYAEGRHDPRSSLGWKRYTASMALYAKFACFEASRGLLATGQAQGEVREARVDERSVR